jgi:hypothetical protein
VAGILAIESGLAAFVAACLSVSGITLRKFEWISQKEWLNEACLNDLDNLKRFRILTMWGVIKSHRKAHAEKAGYLVAAQWVLLLSVALLLAALVAGFVNYSPN